MMITTGATGPQGDPGATGATGQVHGLPTTTSKTTESPCQGPRGNVREPTTRSQVHYSPR